MLSEKLSFMYTTHIIPKKIDRTNCSSFHFVRAPQFPSLIIGHNRFEQERYSSWNIVLQYVWKIFQLQYAQYNCRSFMKAGLSLFVLRLFAVCYVNNMFVKSWNILNFLIGLSWLHQTPEIQTYTWGISKPPHESLPKIIHPRDCTEWRYRCYHQLLLLFRFVRDES